MHPSIFAPDDIKPPASKDAYSAMTIRAARLPHRVFPVRQNGEHHQQTRVTPPASDTWSRPLPRDPYRAACRRTSTATPKECTRCVRQAHAGTRPRMFSTLDRPHLQGESAMPQARKRNSLRSCGGIPLGDPQTPELSDLASSPILHRVICMVGWTHGRGMRRTVGTDVAAAMATGHR